MSFLNDNLYDLFGYLDEFEGGILAPMEESDLSITKPPIPHFGGHYYLAKKLIWYVPEHSVYIEPFLGGGAMFWRKKLVKESILSDMDEELIALWKFIQSGSYSKCNYNDNYNSFIKFIKKCASERKIKGYNSNMCCHYALRRNTYPTSNFVNIPSIDKSRKKFFRSFFNIIDKLDSYKEKLKYAKLLLKDYREVLDKYDCKDAFIYLDPPWITEGMYNDEYYIGEYDFDYDEFLNLLTKIKGYFMFVHNKNKYIYDLAKSKNMKIYSIKSFNSLALFSKTISYSIKYVITNYDCKSLS